MVTTPSSILTCLTLLAIGLLFVGGLFTTVGALQMAQASALNRLAAPFPVSTSTPVVSGDQGTSIMLSGWLIMGLGGLVGLGSWLAAFIQAVRRQRWGWVATLVLASLLLGVGALMVWFPLFSAMLDLSQQSLLATPLPALAVSLVPLPVLGWSLAERRSGLARRSTRTRLWFQ